ncbi:MAG: small nuclear ribonucleoprotein (Sm) [Thermoprotei archaeon]|nr:MAG: small nuclear ribonucleoprotein (Sm) [Thermofilum sp. ex4484_79]RLF08736.1 MAG: small nuclear ribonucleoprotein (Sm) [Thermoprotei archaeon]
MFNIKGNDMSYLDLGSRRFGTEFSSLINKRIIVNTLTQKTFTGILLGYSTSDHSLVLSDVDDQEGNRYSRVILYGHAISEIFLVEEPLDLEELARRLEEVFPKMIKYYPEAKLITVMDRVRVTDKGVEGTGPIAERVKNVYKKFVEEWSRKEK